MDAECDAPVPVPVPVVVRQMRRIGAYEVGMRLGRGGQGKVLSAVAPDGRTVALKLYYREKVPAKDLVRMEREAEALLRLSTVPGVVKLLDCIPDATLACKRGAGAVHPVFVLVLEYLPAALAPFIPLGRRWPEPVIRRYAHDLLNTLYAAHSEGVVHRDIKPGNVLLDDNYGLKVVDFGLCRIVASVFATYMTSYVGTRRHGYLPYEVTCSFRRPYTGEGVDVWTTGVLLFELVAGYPPMDYAQPGDWWWETLAAGETALFWRGHEWQCEVRLPENKPEFWPGLRDLLSAMLCVDPTRRIKVSEALRHPWFTAGPLATDAEVAAWMYPLHCTITEMSGFPPPPLPPILAALPPAEAAVGCAGGMDRDPPPGGGCAGAAWAGGAEKFSDNCMTAPADVPAVVFSATAAGTGVPSTVEIADDPTAIGGGGGGGGGDGGGGGGGDEAHDGSKDPFDDDDVMRSVRAPRASMPSHHPRYLLPEMPMLVDAAAATCAGAIAALPHGWTPRPLPAGHIPRTHGHVAALVAPTRVPAWRRWQPGLLPRAR